MSNPNQPKRTQTVQKDGTIVTTIDFPPGEAENVIVQAMNRQNPNEKKIDVSAGIQGGNPPPGPSGQQLQPTETHVENGAQVTTYKIPDGKDGYVRADTGNRK